MQGKAVRRDVIVFNGIKFVRYPDAANFAERNYYKGKGKWLHRVIWESTHGPIPEGYVVHHVDENPLMNELNNLACIPHPDHAVLHGLAVSGVLWARSEEGREFYREKAQQEWKRKEPLEWTCEQCGRTYYARKGNRPSRFCSDSCRGKHFRPLGVYNEMRTCSICGAEFSVPRYQTTRCCGNSCAMKLRWRDPNFKGRW